MIVTVKRGLSKTVIVLGNTDPEDQEFYDADVVIGLTGKLPIWPGVRLAYDVRPRRWYVSRIHSTQSYRWRWAFGPIAVMAP